MTERLVSKQGNLMRKSPLGDGRMNLGSKADGFTIFQLNLHQASGAGQREAISPYPLAWLHTNVCNAGSTPAVG